MSQRLLTLGVAVWAVVTAGGGLALPALSTYDLGGEVPDADTNRLLAWLLPVCAVVLLPAVSVAVGLARGHAAGIVSSARPGAQDVPRRSTVATLTPVGGWWRWVLPVVGGLAVVLLLRSAVDAGLDARDALVLGALVLLLQVCAGLLVVLVGLFVGMPLCMVALAVQRRSALGARGARAVLALALTVVLIPVVGIAIQVAFSSAQSGGTPRGRAVARVVDVVFLAPATPAVLVARLLALLLLITTVYGVWQLRPDRARRSTDRS